MTSSQSSLSALEVRRQVQQHEIPRPEHDADMLSSAPPQPVVHGLTPSGDLGASPSLGTLDWTPEGRTASLAVVYHHAAAGAESAIEWYLKSKRPKQRLARWIRGSAICLGALAGLIPMVAEMQRFHDRIEPVWASIVLGLAAALVMLDRFFGFSSAWVRYISTELHLRQILEEFRLDFEAEKAAWKDATATDEQLQRALASCHSFVTRVNAIVREETNLWVAEFQDTLKQIDENAKAKLAATAVPGAVSLVITNGDQCEGEWMLSIDDGTTRSGHGKTAAISGLVPGIHTLRIDGSIGAKAVRAEKAITVGAGGVLNLEVNLS
jgi:hypothetical protein